MELKNAGLTTKNCAQHEMLNGTRYFCGKWFIYYDYKTDSFLCSKITDSSNKIAIPWMELEDWQVEVDWKENLSHDNPRWCKVPHREVATGKKSISFQKIYASDGEVSFFNEAGKCFYHAEPVSDELAAMLDAEAS